MQPATPYSPPSSDASRQVYANLKMTQMLLNNRCPIQIGLEGNNRRAQIVYLHVVKRMKIQLVFEYPIHSGVYWNAPSTLAEEMLMEQTGQESTSSVSGWDRLRIIVPNNAGIEYPLLSKVFPYEKIKNGLLPMSALDKLPAPSVEKLAKEQQFLASIQHINIHSSSAAHRIEWPYPDDCPPVYHRDYRRIRVFETENERQKYKHFAMGVHHESNQRWHDAILSYKRAQEYDASDRALRKRKDYCILCLEINLSPQPTPAQTQTQTPRQPQQQQQQQQQPSTSNTITQHNRTLSRPTPLRTSRTTIQL